jgi:hypothetical protein
VQVGFVLGDAGDELFQVVAGGGPVERGGDLVVVVLESVEALDDGLEAGEVVRGQHFALDDGEHELDLVQPRGVKREVHQHEVGPRVPQVAPRCVIVLNAMETVKSS